MGGYAIVCLNRVCIANAYGRGGGYGWDPCPSGQRIILPKANRPTLSFVCPKLWPFQRYWNFNCRHMGDFYGRTTNFGHPELSKHVSSRFNNIYDTTLLYYYLQILFYGTDQALNWITEKDGAKNARPLLKYTRWYGFYETFFLSSVYGKLRTLWKNGQPRAT